MALFRMAFFRLFALVFRHFAWRISFFRLFAWRYFVFSLFRLAFFRYFVFSLGVISSWRRAITPGEKTKERINEMAQTSHHICTFFKFCLCGKTGLIFKPDTIMINHQLELSGTMVKYLDHEKWAYKHEIWSYHLSEKASYNCLFCRVQRD